MGTTSLQIADIAAIEIEVSPWAYEEEAKKVIEIARALDIPIIAYSCVALSPYGMMGMAANLNLK